LSLTAEQRDRLQSILAEGVKSLIHDKREELVTGINVNSIFSSFPAKWTTIPERRDLLERIANKREEQLARIREVLTTEQKEKLAALKGKGFDRRLLNQ